MFPGNMLSHRINPGRLHRTGPHGWRVRRLLEGHGVGEADGVRALCARAVRVYDVDVALGLTRSNAERRDAAGEHLIPRGAGRGSMSPPPGARWSRSLRCE